MLLPLLSFVLTSQFYSYRSQFRILFWSNPYNLPWSNETTLKDNGEQIISRKQSHVGRSKANHSKTGTYLVEYRVVPVHHMVYHSTHVLYILLRHNNTSRKYQVLPSTGATNTLPSLVRSVTATRFLSFSNCKRIITVLDVTMFY